MKGLYEWLGNSLYNRVKNLTGSFSRAKEMLEFLILTASENYYAHNKFPFYYSCNNENELKMIFGIFFYFLVLKVIRGYESMKQDI